MKTELYQKAMIARSYPEFADCFKEGCSRCSLSDHPGNRPVLYRGRPDAPIALFGEAPGREEQRTGIPFVGPAGELLDRILNAIDINTNTDMCITNIVYCQPRAENGSGRQNYTPKTEQIVRCWHFGKKALELLNPKILIACGLPAAHTLLDDQSLKMGEIEGRWLGSRIFVMRHPASLLHLMSHDKDAYLTARAKVWEYMQRFRDTYRDKL